VGLADALVARPPILVLDEPTAGLDPNQIRDVRDVIRELRNEHTVLLSTHILSEVEANCSRIVVIANGKLMAEGSMAELARERRASGVEFVVRGDTARVSAILRSVDGHIETKLSATDTPLVHAFACTFRDDVDTAMATEVAIKALVEAGCFVREARPLRSTLEALFAELTSTPPTSEKAS
jgi:ABC-2 type transport system ATP-binding protein